MTRNPVETGRIIERLEQADGDLAKRLYELRISLGKTQTDMGQLVGVSLQQWQKYERGDNRITASRLAMLAEKTNTSVVELLQQKPTLGANDDGRSDRWALETLHLFRALPPSIRTDVVSIVKKLAEITKEHHAEHHSETA